MYVDACAIVAVLADEAEAARVSDALARATGPITSPIAILEAALALARPDKFDLRVADTGAIIEEFLRDRDITVRDLPPAAETTGLALDAANRFRSGRRGLNLGDCLHYACARYYRVPILATADEFRQTDLDVVN
jgi:ribonuclease VapC